MGHRTIEQGAVRIEAPDGWVDASQLIALGPDGGGYRPSLVVSTQPGLSEEIDAQAFAESLSGTLRAILKGYAVVSEDEATFGPWTGQLREHIFSQGNLQLRQLQFHLVRESTGYVFSFTHRADDADAGKVAASLFERIQFGPPSARALPSEEEGAGEPDLAPFRARPSIGG